MSLSPLCFATLTPENKTAQKCLESLVDSQPPESYIHLVTVARTDADTRHIRPTDRAAQSKYQLVLSFAGSGENTCSSRKDHSWVVGKLGRNSAVDLPLCSSRSRLLQGTQFFSLSIHPQSGALLLQNTSQFHSILYLQADHNADVELHYNNIHVLYMQTNRLRIGPLDLVLEFTASDKTAYTTHLDEYMRRQDLNWDYNRRIYEYGYLDLLPKSTQLELKEIIIHHTISKGAFGVVRAGVEKRSGAVVACKTIHCPRRQLASVRREIDINMQIPAGTVGLVPPLESWCEHNHLLPCAQADLEDVHLLMPFALFTFATAPWQHIDLPSRLAIFRQVLEGLRNLHTMGIMHRDISPSNLLIFSYQTPTAAHAGIADFGKAKRGDRGMEAGLGPLGFISPEVGRPEGYTNAIDVFGLGLSMVATFIKWNGAEPMTRDNHAKILAHLADVPEGLGALLRSMIAWDPSSRPTAEEALADPVWEQNAVVGPNQDEHHSSPDVATRLQRSGGLSLSSSRWINKRMHESAEQVPPGTRSGANKKTRRSGPSGHDNARLSLLERMLGPAAA